MTLDNSMQIAVRGPAGNETDVRLTLGVGLKFPSTTNTRRAATNRKTGRPFIVKSKRTQTQIKALCHAYTHALIGAGVFPPRFYKARVHVHFLVGNLRANADSHNLCKSICDWLELIGMVENDQQIQCWIADAHDYGLTTPTESVLIIQRLDKVLEKCRNFQRSIGYELA